MRRSPLRAFVPLALGVTALAVAACGGGGGGGGKKGTGATGAPVTGKKGGILKVLANSDVDYIDPGQAYYQFSYMLDFATQRPLFSYKPEDSAKETPDLASGPAQVTDGGKTVTIKIRSGVKFSPPVNRAVTSKDVKYALERQFFSSVANGYAGAYFGDTVGAKVGAKPGSKISGITTPDDTTVVIKLKRATGAVVAGALSLPGSAPVPEEYAAKYDAKTTSTYGTHQVSTGPYMIKNDASGKSVGYQPGKKIELVRNPNWNGPQTGDYRKAYLDGATFQEGVDPNVGSRQILTGASATNGDFAPPPQQTKSALSTRRSQIALVPSGGNRYVSMNTTVAPFDNLNLRKAVLAVFDRNAMRLTRGGPALGGIATHFIPPGMNGFNEAGGTAGPDIDYLKNPSGDLKLAQDYMKKAGFPSGKYTGSKPILMVGVNAGVGQKSAEVAQQQFQKLGFKVNLREVEQATMYTKFCNTPKADVAVCPNVGWLKDFADPQTILDPTFNGKNIVPTNNSNWPELNDKAINAAMDKAETITDPAQRAQAWGKIDQMIMEQAPAVPWIWDNQPNIWSKNVNGVINKFNANIDLSFTSIK
jgi:peptide/nickel transport system substrate-binding protein